MLGSLIVACSCWVASSIARLQNELEHSHFFFFRKVDYRGLIHHKGLPCSRRKPRIPPASHRKPDEWPREPAFCQIGVFESHAAHSTFVKNIFLLKGEQRRIRRTKASEGEPAVHFFGGFPAFRPPSCFCARPPSARSPPEHAPRPPTADLTASSPSTLNSGPSTNLNMPHFYHGVLDIGCPTLRRLNNK